MVKLYTSKDVVVFLDQAVMTQCQGVQSEFAEKHGISRPYLNDVLNHRRSPGAKILAILGMEKVVGYRWKNK